MATGDAYGLDAHTPTVSPRRVMESMRDARRRIEPNDSPEKFRRLGIDVVEGTSSFVDPQTIRVGDRSLAARDIVIATGSRTRVPPIDGLDDVGYVDHVTFLDRDVFPRLAQGAADPDRGDRRGFGSCECRPVASAYAAGRVSTITNPFSRHTFTCSPSMTCSPGITRASLSTARAW